MSNGAAEVFFIAGASVFILAGGVHALLALRDTRTPRSFAPLDASVLSAMAGTGVRFRAAFPGRGERPSMWRAWLGFNISHGLGAFAFGVLGLLIATYDFKLVEEIDAFRPLTIAFSAAYFVLSLRFWFYGPAILTGIATVCFSIATALSL